MRPTRGMTLIELLIVIAMMTIMATATMSFIIIPMKKKVTSDVRVDLETGCQMFFTSLLRNMREGEQVIIPEHSDNEFAIYDEDTSLYHIYTINAKRELRYLTQIHDGKTEVSLLEVEIAQADTDVHLLSPAWDLKIELPEGSSRYRIEISAGQEILQTPYGFVRSVEIPLGRPWMESQL